MTNWESFTVRMIVPALFLTATALGAQEPAVPSSNARVKAALERIRADNAWTLDQQQSICEIPAPPFKETARGAEYRRRLEALGYRNVRVDAVGNVIAERPGAGGGPTVVLSAHLDTVFPEGTDVAVKREGGTMRGPGIVDDCRGLAVLLAVGRALNQENVQTLGTVYLVGTVGEEGAGNLRGVRHLYERELAGKIDYFISVDGAGFGVTSRAVGSNRYRVTYQGPGGHSYGAFGMPNPVHALGRAMARISDFQVPARPRTTFNVGVIGGGTSVNSIAMSATMEVDLRSESAEALRRLDAQLQRTLAGALADENARWPDSAVRLTMKLDTLGFRPAGGQPDTARIVRAATASLRALGLTPQPPEASSTDANVAIGLGLPGITIDGGGRGRGAHSSQEEVYEDGDRGWLGPQWAALLVATLAGVR